MTIDNQNIHSRLPQSGADLTDTLEASGVGMFGIFWRRRRLVALMVVVSLGACLVYLGQAVPIYRSTARLYVEPTGPKIVTEQQGLMTQSTNYLYTQSELLRSTPILSRVAEDPNYQKLQTFTASGNPLTGLRNSLAVSVGKKDDIINISLESQYPQEAAILLNAVVDSYITYHTTQKQSTSVEILKILQKEKEKRDRTLAGKLKALLDFTQVNGSLPFQNDSDNIILQRLAKLSDALTVAQLEMVQAKARYEAVNQMMNEPAKIRQYAAAEHPTGVYAAFNEEEETIRGQLDELQLSLETLLRQGTADHPAVRASRSRIAQLKRLQAELEHKFADAYRTVIIQQWTSALQREAEIRQALDEQQQKAFELNAKAAEYAILQSDLQRSETYCDILDDRIKELNITEDAGALNITILEVARPARFPVKPQKSRLLAFALVVSLIVGLALALLIDWCDLRLRNADEIAAVLETPILGAVPSMSPKESLLPRGQKAHLQANSPAAEAYRTIRTAVYYGVPKDHSKILLVTSPAAGDGKTTLVSNLAITMAQAGQRTLIIDADFRNPMQHKIFHLSQQHGLTGILSGIDTLAQAIVPTGINDLDLLATGPVVSHPAEMIGAPAFLGILQELAQRYDRILIDSPPVMQVADARILGAICDRTLLVLRAEKTSRKTALQARRGLLAVGAKLLGAIINDVPFGNTRYGYYGSAEYRSHAHHGSHGFGEGRRRQKPSGQAKAVLIDLTDSAPASPKPISQTSPVLGPKPKTSSSSLKPDRPQT